MTIDLDELEQGLEEFKQSKKGRGSSAREDRIVAGFEDISRFYEEHARLPKNIEGRDIFERLYAVRLEQILKFEDVRSMLASHDPHSLLDKAGNTQDDNVELSDDALLEELSQDFNDSELTTLKNVRSSAEKRLAEEIANRTPCKDFDQFAGLFKQIQADLKSGRRPTGPVTGDVRVEQGDLFIVDGLTAYVADVGDEFLNEGQERKDARLRVIYSNKTESNLLRTSLQKALWKDDTARRVAKDLEGTLFGDVLEEGDEESGIIYVLRSLSDQEFIAAHRNLIHKIGVTGSPIAARVANAQFDPTFLMAGVDVIREYKLVGINRKKLEKLLHQFLAQARLDIGIQDRFGKTVKPREWFLIPLHVIDDVVAKIKNGEITQYIYDKDQACLVRGGE